MLGFMGVLRVGTYSKDSGREGEEDNGVEYQIGELL